MSLFRLKNALLIPRTAWRRWRYRDTDPVGIGLMEHFRYADPIFEHFGAVVEKPDLLVDFPLTTSSVVFDVGGHVGAWCTPMAQRHGCRIEVFEPSPYSRDELRATVDALPDVELRTYGLSGADQVTSFAHKGPGSSTYDDDDRWERCDVELRDVLAVLDELGPGTIDLMKVNIEGGEYELFSRLLDAGRAGDCGHYLIQFHEWLPQAYWRRRQIRRGLHRTHECVWNHPFVWEYWRHRDLGRGR